MDADIQLIKEKLGIEVPAAALTDEQIEAELEKELLNEGPDNGDIWKPSDPYRNG